MPLRVAGAQIDLVVGDLAGNEEKIAAAMEWAEAENADVLLLPELAVTGYPPEDLVLRPGFVDHNREVVRRLARRSGRCATIVGFVDHAGNNHRGSGDSLDRRVANAVAIIEGGELVGTYHKVLLPNYGVFDEDRYFSEGQEPDRIWQIAGVPVGVSICEDIWLPDGPPHRQAQAGARVLLNVNGSPYHRGKAAGREEMLVARARAAGAPLVYLNLVGGQDELVFDGASVVIAADGTVIHRSPQFVEDRFVLDVPLAGEPVVVGAVTPMLEPIEEIYQALITGVRDYIRKNGFTRVVIGLSGGIDSALTAVIAADALGPENVWGISMPTRFSSEGSVSDSRQLAEALGIRFDVIPIEPVFTSYLETLAPVFEGTDFGVAEENLQARIRGALLMATSNKFGPMLLTTGNKSEMAAGYATLYGDMAGGYSALKDVFKTTVYELSRWRNRDGEVIPWDSIEKPPSAELRPDQKDSDSLPPYDLLDAILERYIEDDMVEEEIIAEGFDAEIVRRIAALVDRNEYKRRQAAPGVKITPKAFGRDRRLPITNKYRG
jgi:NAD+ synthase (glutamine-hydrolysing)